LIHEASIQGLPPPVVCEGVVDPTQASFATFHDPSAPFPVKPALPSESPVLVGQSDGSGDAEPLPQESEPEQEPEPELDLQDSNSDEEDTAGDQGMQILIIEDNGTNQFVLQCQLRRLGVSLDRVSVASDGKEGVIAYLMRNVGLDATAAKAKVEEEVALLGSDFDRPDVDVSGIKRLAPVRPLKKVCLHLLTPLTSLHLLLS